MSIIYTMPQGTDGQCIEIGYISNPNVKCKHSEGPCPSYSDHCQFVHKHDGD